MKLKPYPGYKPSDVEWLGDVPEPWEVNKLKHVARFWNSNVDKVPADEEIPVRLLNYTDVYYNEQLHPGMELMETTAKSSEVQRFRLVENDVVITKDSESWDDIAVPGLVVESASDFVCGYHLAMIRSRPEKLFGPYLFRLLQSSAINQQFQVAATGVTRYGLPQSAIGDALLPVPPVAEQKAIAGFLDERTAGIDALVEKRRRLIERLKEKRSALISHTVTRGLPPDAARAAGLDPHPRLKSSGIEWLGDVPEHWNFGNIRRFAKMKSGHTPSRTKPGYWDDCNIPWFTLADVWQIRDVSKKYIDETTEQISKIGLANSSAELLPANTVILSRTASVGFSGIMAIPMATSQDYWNWVCGSMLRPEYLWYSFKAMDSEFERLTMGSTHKTIYQADAASFVICVPPVQEQEHITQFLDDETGTIDRMIKKVESAIERLQEYRSALITAAVTGKIDVRGSGDAAIVQENAR